MVECVCVRVCVYVYVCVLSAVNFYSYSLAHYVRSLDRSFVRAIAGQVLRRKHRDPVFKKR
jgi:hypothetical protein